MLAPLIEDLIACAYRTTTMTVLRSLASIHILAKFTTHTETTLEELDQQIATFDNAYSVCAFFSHFWLNLTIRTHECRTLQQCTPQLAPIIPNFTLFHILLISSVAKAPPTIITLGWARLCILKVRRITATQTIKTLSKNKCVAGYYYSLKQSHAGYRCYGSTRSENF